MNSQPGDYAEPPGSDPRVIHLGSVNPRGVIIGQEMDMGIDHRVMSIGTGRGRGVAIGQERRELRRPMELPPGMSQDAEVPAVDRNNVQMGAPTMDVLKVSKLNACAQEFVPSWLQAKPAQPKETSTNADDPLNYTMCHIEEIILQMTLCPGDFDSLAMPLVRFLTDAITSENTLKEVVNMIFEQSINQANFRYNGARLCNILSNHMMLNINGESFRSLLLKRCHRENEMISTNLVDKSERVFGFSLFVGELYTHLELNPRKGGPTEDMGRSSQRIAVLAKALPRILNTIVQQHRDSNVKNVCQVLKFTGGSLADEEGLEAEMDILEESLRKACASPGLSEHIRQLAYKVLELKACNWGRESVPVQAPAVNQQQLITQFQNTSILDGGVAYGPDGQQLTEEENQFIAEQLAYLEDDENDSPGEMDEEMQRDYDKFLRDMGK